MNDQYLFNHLKLSTANQKRLQQQAKYYHFPKTETVIHKGQSLSGAYLVLEGQLRVYTYSTDGTEATLYLLNPGDTCVLTINCLFNNLLYPAWVEAKANSCAVLIPGELYRHFFAEEESIRDMTVKALSTLVFRLMDELEEVHSCTLKQRLVSYLLNNASNDAVVTITQQALANHLGTSREVIARLIQELTSRKMIKTARGRITLQDTQALSLLITEDEQ